MEFMGFHIVDIIIVVLVAFLAIKGLVNGFTKELLNFISIVAGVLLAARYNTMAVQFINEQELVPKISDDFANIIGFIIIILTVWLVIGFISSIISNFTSRPSGFLSRLMGYILSAGRYLFIFSLIIFAVSQADFFEKSATKFKAETKLFEPMSEVGAMILNIDLNQSIPKDSNGTSSIKKVNENNLSKTPSSTLTEQNASN